MSGPASLRLSTRAARRMALGAQGFADPAPTGRVDVRHLRRALGRMQVVQLDSVQYVTRSHELTFLARLGPHDRAALHRFLWRSGEVVEVWSHEASVVAAELEPLHRWRQAAAREGETWRSFHRIATEHPGYVGSVLAEVTERGPLRAGELSDPRRRTGEWWANRSVGKLALEWLFATGELAAVRNERFERCYDRPDRLLPPEVRRAPTPDPDDARRSLLERAGRALGVATLADLADYFRIRVPVARPLVADLVEDGRLLPAAVEGWDEPAVVHPDAARPRRIGRTALLSPFDPVVWSRPRAERLFGFRYRIEIYVPAARREYGYYVLPVLTGGDLVGRVDARSDRAASVLRVRAAWSETGADAGAVAAALAPALSDLARHLGLGGVVVGADGSGGRRPVEGLLAAALG